MPANAAAHVTDMPRKPTSPPKLNAQQLVRTLIVQGLRPEQIAAKLGVCTASVTRWRDGANSPQPGTLKRLSLLVRRRR